MTCAGGIMLPGFTCPKCGTFTGTAKDDVQACRVCGEPRPKIAVVIPPCPGCDKPESCGACWMKLTEHQKRALHAGRRR